MVPVSFYTHGASILAAPVTLAPSPHGVNVDYFFPLRNLGDRAITLRVDAGAGGTRNVIVPPAVGTQPGTASVALRQFVASGPASTNITLTDITVGESQLCGSLPSGLTVTSTGVGEPVSATVSDLNFGAMVCRGSPVGARVVELRSLASIPITFDASIGASSPHFSVSPASGSIAPGGAVTLTVTPRMLSNETPGEHVELLRVHTSTGQRLDINLLFEIVGARIRINADRPVPLPQTAPGTASPSFALPVTVQTNVPVSMRTTATGAAARDVQFAFDGTSVNAVYTPSSASVEPITVAFDTASPFPLCAPIEGGPLVLTPNTTSAVLLTAPPSISVGSNLCGSMPPPVSFELRNPGGVPVPFTTNAQSLVGYFSVSPTSGTIPPGGAQQISVAYRQPVSNERTARSPYAAAAYADRIRDWITVAAGAQRLTVDVTGIETGFAYSTTFSMILPPPRPDETHYFEFFSTRVGGTSPPVASYLATPSTTGGCLVQSVPHRTYPGVVGGLYQVRCPMSGSYRVAIAPANAAAPNCSPRLTFASR
ncbi:MAG: hypothetical protein JNK05_16850 [Myxococcales bacterium]|nr:hypothetical protein [Myxococcales bacterium]